MTAGRKGSSLLKKLLLGAVAVVVLAVAAAAAAPFFINWEKVRQMAETRGSAALGRDVTIKALRVSLLSGVEIDGVKIGPPRQAGFGKTPMLEAGRIVAKYRLLPLLWLKVVVNRVELAKPEIFLERNRKGRWSFADLMAGPAKPAAGGTPAPVVLPVDVNVKTVVVSDGALTIRDASGRKPTTSGLDRLNVQLRNFSLDGSTADLKASVVARLDKAELPITVEGGLAVSLNRSWLGLQGLAVSIPGLACVLAGEVTEFQTLPTMHLKSKTTVDLAKLWAGVSPFLDPALARSTGLSGSATADVDLAGTMKALTVKGTATCQRVGVRYGEYKDALENLEGTLTFDQDRVATSDLRGITVGIPFTVDCDIRNLGLAKMQSFAYAKLAPRGKFNVVIPNMVVDRFMPAPGAAAPKAGASAPPPVEMCFVGMIPKGVQLEGDVRIDAIHARKLTLGKATHHVKITGPTIAYTRNAEEYGGRETGSGWIALGKCPMEYSVKADLANVQIGPFMADSMATFLDPKMIPSGTLAGVAALSLNVTGRGTTFPNLKKNLKGKGTLLVADGKASGFVKPAGALVKAIKADSLTKDLIFKSLGGSYTIASGVVTTPDFTLDPGSAGDLGVLYKGTVDFDMNLKGEMTTRISPKYADDAMKSQIMTKDGAGWAVGLWDVSGTMVAPVILPSKKAVVNRAKQEATTQLKKAAPQLEESGKKLLKGLFKH